MRIITGIMCAAALIIGGTAIAQEEELGNKADRKRHKIDTMEKSTLSHLFTVDSDARDRYDAAYGYAVFNSIKIGFGLSGGGGSGVAVDKSRLARTYMKMGTGGIGLGLGGQRYHTVFLFENESTFNEFVNKGWQADTSAHAVAGTKGKNVASTFWEGLAVYQITHNGLMIQADLAGTKYWKHKKLNS